MTKYNESFQLVPPHTHRANAAERAIQTFNNHFKAGLASLDPDFPVAEWDRLLEQAFLTLNLLRSARVNPSLSAYAYLFENFNFNATPLAPPGTKVVVHSKPGNRASWDANGKEGWYIGHSPNHYRCMQCYIPTTRAEINADTIVFFPKVVDFPTVNIDSFLRQAATDIITLLTNPPTKTPLPSLEAGNSTRNAILQLATILGRNPLQDETMNTAKCITLKEASTTSPHTINNISHQSTPLDTTPLTKLKQLAARLARVLQQKSSADTIKTPQASKPNSSFKHRAAAYLITNKGYETPINKSFHIYNPNNEILTLEEIISTPHLTSKACHIFDDNGRKTLPRQSLKRTNERHME